MQFLLKGFAQLLGNRLGTLNFSYTWHTNRSIMGSAQSWGNKFLSITTSCPQPQLSLPWVHVRERFVTYLCFSAKLLFPATAHLPRHRGRWRRDERAPVVFIYHGFSPDVSLWGGSWESWRGSELPYQNLQR